MCFTVGVIARNPTVFYNALPSQILFSGFVVLYIDFLTSAHSINTVSNTVLHICTSPLTPHYAVPQLQSPFTPSAYTFRYMQHTNSSCATVRLMLSALLIACHVPPSLFYSVQVNPSPIFLLFVRGRSSIPAAMTSDASQVTTLLVAVAL